MNLTQYLAQPSAKSASEIAREVGVSPAMVYQWKRHLRPIPTEYGALLEKATGGAVSRRDIRPDDWHLIWPELAEKEGSCKDNAGHSGVV